MQRGLFCEWRKDNLENDDSAKIIHGLIDSKRSIKTFASMFHNNSLQKSLSITFSDIVNIINRKIDFLKFDIEGYEKCIFQENYNLFKTNIYKCNTKI